MSASAKSVGAVHVEVGNLDMDSVFGYEGAYQISGEVGRIGLRAMPKGADELTARMALAPLLAELRDRGKFWDLYSYFTGPMTQTRRAREGVLMRMYDIGIERLGSIYSGLEVAEFESETNAYRVVPRATPGQKDPLHELMQTILSEFIDANGRKIVELKGHGLKPIAPR